MKKILLTILIFILYFSSNAQSPLRINKYLIDSLAGNGFWYIYHDSTHTGQWGLLGSGSGGSGSGDYTILGGRNVTGGTNNFGAITSGTDNFALGNNLFNNATSASLNFLWGKNVASRITTANDIISIGYNNLININVSNMNSSPGINIGHDNNGYSKYKNLAIGSYNNGFNVDSADAVNAIMADNMSIGVENLINLRVGQDNMFFSWDGGEVLDSGWNNVGIGQYALQKLTSGWDNVAIGHKSGNRITGGDRNVFIGDSSGKSTGNTTINKSVFIGSRSRFTGTALSNVIVIGDSALASQNNIFVAGRTGTRLAVGRATATESIHTDSAILIGPRATTTDGTIAYQSNAFVFRQNGVDVALGGGTGARQEFTNSTSTSITLSNTPLSSQAEMYYVDGVLIAAGNVSRVGTTVTFSGFTRYINSVITAQYSY